jgi:DNA ligase (NAD+)
MDAVEQMRSLIKQLNRWAREYYTFDAPSVADETYDAAYDRLVLLEKQTGVVLPDSPTHRVGGEILSDFKPHKHLVRLYSLDKAKSFNELKSWYDKIVKEIPDAVFTVEYKYDGLTLNLTYDEGRLINAATRGDGVKGELITAQAKTIKSVPLNIDFEKTIEIQGEGIMRLSVFNQYNKLHPEEQFKSARNAAAGAIRNLNTAITAQRNLDVVTYSTGFDGGSGIKSQTELVEFLKQNGFKTNGYFKTAKNYEQIKECIEEIGEQRETLDFLIDGAVVKVNDFKMRNYLGYTDKFPRWAIAFKFKAEEVTTTLNSVEWQVGRTGKITPLGHMEPVELCGATIRRATLNNFDDVVRKNLSIGSKVFVRRSNDVIPEVLGLAEETDKSKPIVAPQKCPVCGNELIKKGVNLFCPNTYGCVKQIEARITHFCSKNAFDIEGISDKTVRQLLSLNVTSPIDLFNITKAQLLTLEGFKDKKAQNIIDAVQKSKNVLLPNFIYALGIDNVGVVTAKQLADRYKNMDALKKAKAEDLVLLQDVGQVVAQSITDFFDSAYGSTVTDGLKALGIWPTLDETIRTGVFKDKKVVLTGTLQSLSRSQASKLIEERGGTVSSSVTKDVNLVIAGENAGSKLTKAQQEGITVIDEAAFLKMLET